MAVDMPVIEVHHAMDGLESRATVDCQAQEVQQNFALIWLQ